MSEVFSIHRQMQSSFKNKNKCKEISYSSSGWEEKALYIPADTSRIPLPPVLTLRLHLPTSLWTTDVSSETTNMRASKIPHHYGTRFCNPFCFTSSLEIKASCVSVTLLQPDFSSSLQPSFFCSELTSRTQLPTAADWALEGDVGGIFHIPSFREKN